MRISREGEKVVSITINGTRLEQVQHYTATSGVLKQKTTNAIVT